MSEPQYGIAYTFILTLVDQANRPQYKASPTLATGDFKLSKDNGALANLTTLPSVAPAGSKAVLVSLSATEMTCGHLMILASDAAGAEWDDVSIYIEPRVVTADADVLLARQMTEAYAADGVAPTVAQALFMMLQGGLQFGIVGTTLTTQKLDKTTPAMTHTLDDAVTPTSRTRAT